MKKGEMKFSKRRDESLFNNIAQAIEKPKKDISNFEMSDTLKELLNQNTEKVNTELINRLSKEQKKSEYLNRDENAGRFGIYKSPYLVDQEARRLEIKKQKEQAEKQAELRKVEEKNKEIQEKIQKINEQMYEQDQMENPALEKNRNKYLSRLNISDKQQEAINQFFDLSKEHDKRKAKDEKQIKKYLKHSDNYDEDIEMQTFASKNYEILEVLDQDSVQTEIEKMNELKNEFNDLKEEELLQEEEFEIDLNTLNTQEPLIPQLENLDFKNMTINTYTAVINEEYYRNNDEEVEDINKNSENIVAKMYEYNLKEDKLSEILVEESEEESEGENKEAEKETNEIISEELNIENIEDIEDTESVENLLKEEKVQKVDEKSLEVEEETAKEYEYDIEKDKLSELKETNVEENIKNLKSDFEKTYEKILNTKLTKIEEPVTVSKKFVNSDSDIKSNLKEKNDGNNSDKEELEPIDRYQEVLENVEENIAEKTQEQIQEIPENIKQENFEQEDTNKVVNEKSEVDELENNEISEGVITNKENNDCECDKNVISSPKKIGVTNRNSKIDNQTNILELAKKRSMQVEQKLKQKTKLEKVTLEESEISQKEDTYDLQKKEKVVKDMNTMFRDYEKEKEDKIKKDNLLFTIIIIFEILIIGLVIAYATLKFVNPELLHEIIANILKFRR